MRGHLLFKDTQEPKGGLSERLHCTVLCEGNVALLGLYMGKNDPGILPFIFQLGFVCHTQKVTFIFSVKSDT